MADSDKERAALEEIRASLRSKANALEGRVLDADDGVYVLGLVIDRYKNPNVREVARRCQELAKQDATFDRQREKSTRELVAFIDELLARPAAT